MAYTEWTTVARGSGSRCNNRLKRSQSIIRCRLRVASHFRQRIRIAGDPIGHTVATELLRQRPLLLAERLVPVSPVRRWGPEDGVSPEDGVRHEY